MMRYRRGILSEGRFGYAGKSGMVLTEGYFLVRRSGGYNFYLAKYAQSAFDFTTPIACCGPDRREIDIEGMFEPNRDHWIAIKSVGKFGLESEGYQFIRVRTDSNLDGKPVPEYVQNLRFEIDRIRGNGKVNIIWDYEPAVGSVRPAVFKVYMVEGEAPNYSYYPIGEEEYVEGRRTYVHRSYLGWDLLYRVAVRAETADGVDDGNERFIVARGNGDVPGDTDDLVVEQYD